MAWRYQSHTKRNFCTLIFPFGGDESQPLHNLPLPLTLWWFFCRCRDAREERTDGRGMFTITPEHQQLMSLAFAWCLTLTGKQWFFSRWDLRECWCRKPRQCQGARGGQAGIPQESVQRHWASSRSLGIGPELGLIEVNGSLPGDFNGLRISLLPRLGTELMLIVWEGRKTPQEKLHTNLSPWRTPLWGFYCNRGQYSPHSSSPNLPPRWGWNKGSCCRYSLLSNLFILFPHTLRYFLSLKLVWQRGCEQSQGLKQPFPSRSSRTICCY